MAIAIPGISIPVLASWLGGQINFGKSRKITEASMRNLALASVGGVGAALAAYYLLKPSPVVRVSAPAVTPKAGPEVILASPVTNQYYSHMLGEFVAGTPPYPESPFIVVD